MRHCWTYAKLHSMRRGPVMRATSWRSSQMARVRFWRASSSRYHLNTRRMKAAMKHTPARDPRRATTAPRASTAVTRDKTAAEQRQVRVRQRGDASPCAVNGEASVGLVWPLVGPEGAAPRATASIEARSAKLARGVAFGGNGEETRPHDQRLPA